MSQPPGGGKFIISLDFELMWGVRDIVTTETYGNHIKGVHKAIPRMLDCFQRHSIRATFAAVGLLFFESKEEMMQGLPAKKPQYKNTNLSPYGDYLDQQVGKDHTTDPYHFGPKLIQLIKNTPGQEIGTHTFSHYYCLEEGQTVDDFREDLKAAFAIAEKRAIRLRSIIFPRNQFNKKYLEVCQQAGITTYRNNEESWLYNARSGEKESLTRRAFRLIDAYVNITGHHGYSEEYMMKAYPMINVPSSRFLRPYSERFRMLDNIRLNRIRNSMTHAAKNNLMYHLWWHPHNFGINQDQNFAFLEKILLHYQDLRKQYGFESVTMSELSEALIRKGQPQPHESKFPNPVG
jgi:peptidoglycan/xylan/chitin deacetylase (PgdA/CDA1 family)